MKSDLAIGKPITDIEHLLMTPERCIMSHFFHLKDFFPSLNSYLKVVQIIFNFKKENISVSFSRSLEKKEKFLWACFELEKWIGEPFNAFSQPLLFFQKNKQLFLNIFTNFYFLLIEFINDGKD